MFVLKGLLRAETQEMILIYLMLRESGYGKSISEFYDAPANPIHKQLAKLEADGVIVGQSVGKVRNFMLNPRYPFIDQLKSLLKAAVAAYPPDIVNALMVQRTRPRQPGKALSPVRDIPRKNDNYV